ncbi:MAG: hypothetical protein FWD62_01885 [Betaproteobacteria bacterium]|nr:hypothetical protein [Betaproteobacteria bacterium]
MKALVALLAVVAGLSGCVVAPTYPNYGVVTPGVAVVAPAPVVVVRPFFYGSYPRYYRRGW